MRVLSLCPFPPSNAAVHGGARALAGLMAALATRHEVGVLCLRREGDAGVDGGLKSKLKFVEEVGLPEIRFGPGDRWSRLKWLLASKPLWAHGWRSDEFARRASRIRREWRPDVVQIEYHAMGQYIEGVDDGVTPIVLVEYEPGITAALEEHESAKGLARIVAALQLRAWRRFEARVLAGVDAVVTLTDRDRRILASLNERTRIVTIPLAVEVPDHPLNPLGDEPPGIVFVGNFGHPPNVEAARRLAEEILPAVKLDRPEVRLVLVGPDPESRVAALGRDDVIVTGKVDSVERHLDRASVVVVPLTGGGGMRVKVLEALAAGKAVIASSLAVEGLGVTDGVNVLIAESNSEFASAIVELMGDRERRRAIAGGGREFALAEFSWERRADQYSKLYEGLIDRAGERSRVEGERESWAEAAR